MVEWTLTAHHSHALWPSIVGDILPRIGMVAFAQPYFHPHMTIITTHGRDLMAVSLSGYGGSRTVNRVRDTPSELSVLVHVEANGPPADSAQGTLWPFIYYGRDRFSAQDSQAFKS